MLCCSVDAGGQDSDPRLSWVNVRPYLGVNDHLKGVAQGRHAAKVSREVVLLNTLVWWFHQNLNT